MCVYVCVYVCVCTCSRRFPALLIRPGVFVERDVKVLCSLLLLGSVWLEETGFAEAVLHVLVNLGSKDCLSLGVAIPWLSTCLGGAVGDRKGPRAWPCWEEALILPFGRVLGRSGAGLRGMCLSWAHRAALLPERRVQPAGCLACERSSQHLSRGASAGVTVRSV